MIRRLHIEQAWLTTEVMKKKFYFGLTDNIFKERYRNQVTIEILNIRHMKTLQN